MDRVVSQRPRTLAEVVAIACVAEDVLSEQYGLMSKKDKAKATATLDQFSKKNKKSKKRMRNEDQEPKKDIPLCPTCGKWHVEECWRNNNKCFSCRGTSHIKQKLPKDLRTEEERERADEKE